MERHVYERMAEIDRDHWWFVGRRRILTVTLVLVSMRVGTGTGARLGGVGFGRHGAPLGQRDCAARIARPSEAIAGSSVR